MDFACEHRAHRAAEMSGAAIQDIVDALVRRDLLSMWRSCLLFKANPTVLIKRMLSNMRGYAHGLPDLLLKQYLYDPIAHICDGFLYPLFILLLPGWIYMVKQERDLAILSFGFVLLLSTMLSAAVIVSSDGLRGTGFRLR
jgi:hypothetical protein